MSALIDTINKLDETTADLEVTDKILSLVCENYFSRTAEVTNATYLYDHYENYSTIVNAVKRQLWDIIDEYRKVSDELVAINKAAKAKKAIGERDYMDDTLYQILRAEEAVVVLEEALNQMGEPRIANMISVSIDILNQALPEAGNIISEYVKQGYYKNGGAE